MKISERIRQGSAERQAKGQDEITRILTNAEKLIPLLDQMMKDAQALSYIVGKDKVSKANVRAMMKLISGMRGHARIDFPRSMKNVRLP